MESGNVEHADGLGNGAVRTKRRKQTQAESPAALLRLLIEHAEYDLALLFTKGQYILYQRVGRELRVKVISPATLRAAFVEEPVDSGWLSPDIVRCGSGPAGAFVVKYVPAGRTSLQFSTQGRQTARACVVPLPPLVFAGVNAPFNGAHASYYVWAIGGSQFDPKAPLYHAPLPNVYGDGRICFGSNAVPEVGRQSVDKAWQLFITSPFTGEVVSGKSRLHPQDVRNLLLTLEGAERYPVEDLAAFEERSVYYTRPNVKTVSDAVAKFILKEEQWF